jgi:hypothetical protein
LIAAAERKMDIGHHSASNELPVEFFNYKISNDKNIAV